MIAEMNIRAGGKIAPDFMLKLDDRDITQISAIVLSA